MILLVNQSFHWNFDILACNIARFALLEIYLEISFVSIYVVYNRNTETKTVIIIFTIRIRNIVNVVGSKTSEHNLE